MDEHMSGLTVVFIFWAVSLVVAGGLFGALIVTIINWKSARDARIILQEAVWRKGLSYSARLYLLVTDLTRDGDQSGTPEGEEFAEYLRDVWLDKLWEQMTPEDRNAVSRKKVRP